MNLSLKVGGSCTDGLALLTLAGRSNLGKKPMGGTQWGSFTFTRVTLVTTETQQKFERSKASPPKVAT